MYEFLAPWGVLVPAVSAVVIHAIISRARRKKQMTMIYAPTDAPDSVSRCALSQGLA